MSQVLSQKELDLILQEMTGIDQSPHKADSWDAGEVVPYDLAQPDRVIRGRMPTLELIHDRFARLFRQTLSSHMRRPMSVMVRSTELLNFKDFIKSIEAPTSLNMFHINPLRGMALLVLDRPLAYSLVDLLFGGSGHIVSELPQRDFTNIELRMVAKVVHSAIRDYELSWKPVAPVKMKYVRAESNPHFVAVVTESEIVSVTTYDVEIHDSPMTLTICLPYSMLEPIRGKLNAGYQSEHLEVNQAIVNRLTQILNQSTVNVKINLGTTSMTLRDFLSLKEGDLIPLTQEVDKPLNVQVQNVVKFKGLQGAYKGHKAIKLTDLIHEPVDKDHWLEIFESKEN